MKSILIEDLVDMKLDECHSSVEFSDENGKRLSGWAIAKPLNMDKEIEIEIDSSTVCARIVSNDEFLHSTDKDIEDLKDRMFGKKRKDSIYYGDAVKLPLRVLLKLYRNVKEVAEATGKRIS